MYNAGIQQALTKSLTLTLNYAGTESHFVLTGGSNARGLWSNQLDPKYLMALAGVADSTGTAPILGASATPANVAIVQSKLSGFQVPYAGSLVPQQRSRRCWFIFLSTPGVSDLWGQNVGNLSYNALQVSLNEASFHGLTYSVNYTWSRNLGDDGTFRSGYDIPAGAVSGSGRRTLWIASSVLSPSPTTPMPSRPSASGRSPSARITSVALLPSDVLLPAVGRCPASTAFNSGTPFVPTYGGCTAPANSGTCMLDLNPAYSGNGKLASGYRHFKTQYIDPNAFKAPATFSSNLSTKYTMIGNAPRTAPYGLRNPYFCRMMPLSSASFTSMTV